MAIIRKKLRVEPGNFTTIDNQVIQNHDLSEGARLLYCFLASLPNAAQWNDGGVCGVLGISLKTLRTRKRELKNLDLILIDQVGPREYFMYIGTTTFTASAVRLAWLKQDKALTPEATTVEA